jgi:cell wall-associated NlpC family hydrolase
MIAGSFLRIGKACGLFAFAVMVSGCGLGRPYKNSMPPSMGTAALLQTARSQLGIPCHAGGDSPLKGFDCSGFTQWVFRQHGIPLPRQSYEQYRIGQQVKSGKLRSGDLVFFDVEKQGASHVGIYMGQGWFIHCSGTGGHVQKDNLGKTYWQEHYLGARRILP